MDEYNAPWEAQREDESLIDWRVVDADGSTVVTTKRMGGTERQIAATARLIAAAPDLLAAVETLLVARHEDAAGAARTAIAKAKGVDR